MKKMNKDIIIENAKNYHQYAGMSYGGALLKSSLIPLNLLIKYLPNQAKILDLGCGEGMFSNALGRLLPNAEIIGVDLNAEKIKCAQSCQLENVTFHVGDAKNFLFENADVVIFNDMLHHNSFQEQAILISKARDLLKNEGLLILKEVNVQDKFDRFMTTFFDKKLYPDDPLDFRETENWKSFLEASYFENLNVEIVKHPWVASRTMIIAKKVSKPICHIDGVEGTATIDYDNGKLKVFLTGASGFIGHHMAKYLLENGLGGRDVDLILLARTPIKLDAHLREHVTIIQGDLLSLERIKHWKIFNHIDFVFHFAAEVKVHGDPNVLVRNNVKGTHCLINLFQGKVLKRFIHASTMGAVDRQPDDDCQIPINEEFLPNPLTQYGITKKEAEELVQSSNLPFSIVRIPWAFGSRMTPDTHVRNLMERTMFQSLATKFNFPGKVSIIAVEDLVKAFALVATHHKAINNIFFVAGYPPVSLGTLFQKMTGFTTGRTEKQIPIPVVLQFLVKKIRRFLPLTIQNLNSDVLCVDYSKITKLGFKPEQDLDLSLLRLRSWILAGRHPHPQKSLCVVTGAASGIGLALSCRLVETGRKVLLVDRNQEKLKEAANRLRMPYLCLDLSSFADVQNLMNRMNAEQDFNGLINCAGIGKRDLLINIPHKQIEKIIAVNISALAQLSKEALEILKKQEQGFLINISSSSALQPFPYFSVYAASKAFVSNFTGALCFENDNKNIKIFDVVPSGTDTSFQQSAGVKKNPKELLLSPEYVAKKIVQLLDKKNQNGTHIIGNKGKVMSLMARILPRSLNLKIWGNLIVKSR